MRFSRYIWLTVLSVIKNQKTFRSLITGKPSYPKQHCPADGVGGDELLLILACIYMKFKQKNYTNIVNILVKMLHFSQKKKLQHMIIM